MITREQIDAIYDDALESNSRPIHPEYHKTYDGFQELFEKLMTIVEEDGFYWGYQLGYEAGRKSA